MKKTRLLMALAAAAAIALVAMWFVNDTRERARYDRALALSKGGHAAEAYALFLELGHYADAEAQAEALLQRDPWLPCRIAGRGDVIELGRWEQDGDSANGPERLEWIVLDRIENQLLLLSAFCLEGRPYNDVPFDSVTWETCSLRDWLNGEFLTAAFTQEERARIPAVRNENADHSLVETAGGADTLDRVFLLSETDGVIYLAEAIDQQTVGLAYATDAALAAGLQHSQDNTAAWWLRSPGMYEWVAQYVDDQGAPNRNGANVDIGDFCGVRPALWLDLTVADGGGEA